MTTKKTTSKTDAKTDTTTRDAFGSREGSLSYAMNAVIIAAKGKPVTVDTIVEKSGCTKARVRAHIKWLADRDHVVKTDDGCKSKPATKRSTKKTTKNGTK